MKKILFILTLAMAFSIHGDAATNPGFAVVELFTSEGCSSCPPADALLAEIQQENSSKSVYVLAFHVDYWDRLGWKDRFSDHSFTRRQQEYASLLHSDEIYTPQAIVNGKTSFVGSEAAKMRSVISTELKNPGNGNISLSDIKVDKSSVYFKYSANSPKSARIIFALVQKQAVSQVEAGENQGRTLAHIQIVRNFTSVDLENTKNGEMHLNIPEGIDARQFEIIAFVQNTSDGAITAAAKS